MNIITYFNDFVMKNFKLFLEKYYKTDKYWNKQSNINNYISFMNDIDEFSYKLNKNIIQNYFEYIDTVFFNTKYRRKNCISKGFVSRTILTMFGEITFKRRYYIDKTDNSKFFFTDLFFNLPKRNYFDPFICADICSAAASNSYSKSGKIVAEKIGKKLSSIFNISRASARNIVMNFNIPDTTSYNDKKISRLLVMLDEKFVGSQFNDGVDHMIKAAVIFEGTSKVYKNKLKPNSIDRYQLVNPYVCADINNDLLKQVVDYIYNNYDTSYLNEITFMGDCAKWIKEFPHSFWFKFNPNTKINFAMDGFHFSQALKLLTTNKNKDIYNILKSYVIANNKKAFIQLTDLFIESNPTRKETIESKKNYILNNWKERQLYQNNSYMKCSMESHISHIFADLFTSRPKAYSKKGLNKLLKIRVLKTNKIDIKQLYLNSLTINNSISNINSPLSYTNIFFKNSNDFLTCKSFLINNHFDSRNLKFI